MKCIHLNKLLLCLHCYTQHSLQRRHCVHLVPTRRPNVCPMLTWTRPHGASPLQAPVEASNDCGWFSVLWLYCFTDFVQWMFKYGDVQHTSFTPDKELNKFIYVLMCRSYKLLKQSVFVPPCTLCRSCHVVCWFAGSPPLPEGDLGRVMAKYTLFLRASLTALSLSGGRGFIPRCTWSILLSFSYNYRLHSRTERCVMFKHGGSFQWLV